MATTTSSTACASAVFRTTLQPPQSTSTALPAKVIPAVIPAAVPEHDLRWLRRSLFLGRY
jgi:hypothetical protein